MKVLFEDIKKIILIKSVIIPIIFYPIFNFSDSIDIAIFAFIFVLSLLVPPLRNIKLSPKYEMVDVKGVVVVYFWGIKKRYIGWNDITFIIIKNEIYLRESSNNRLIAILGFLISLDNLQMIMKYINPDHPDFQKLNDFAIDYQVKRKIQWIY